MSTLSLAFPPPQNWQDFEKLMKGVVDVIWKQQGWHSYGRLGQSQSGIDIFGYDEGNRFTGVQCKRKAADLSQLALGKDIKKAESIKSPDLTRLIFATTALRDRKVQDIVRKFSDERKKDGKFQVDIWFWEDIQVLLERHTELMYWYYSDILEKVHKYDKNIHILIMLRQAFTRPAFRRPINREESGGDFIQAIRNTQEAITTGNLYNRKGDLLASTYDYSKITNDNWKKEIWEIYLKLDKVRDLYQAGLLAGTIREHPTVLEVLDDRLAKTFNELRAECLETLNIILDKAKIEKIHSELLHHF